MLHVSSARTLNGQGSTGGGWGGVAGGGRGRVCDEERESWRVFVGGKMKKRKEKKYKKQKEKGKEMLTAGGCWLAGVRQIGRTEWCERV